MPGLEVREHWSHWVAYISMLLTVNEHQVELQEKAATTIIINLKLKKRVINLK